jgi:hypothetical protein
MDIVWYLSEVTREQEGGNHQTFKIILAKQESSSF